MKLLVTPLYHRGKPIPREKRVSSYMGDLIITDQTNAVLGRSVREARLFGDNGFLVIDPLVDIQLTGMGSDGFILRGVEYLGDQQVIQEWWVRTPSSPV